MKKFNVDILFYVMLLLFFTFSLLFALFFRDAVRDETIYIHETFLMSELLKNGIWFGDYAVGLHGFLFKIPPAIVFMFTGPSVLILTVYNILLACLVAFLFYKFLKEAFAWRINAILALGLLMSSFHFLLTTPTYLREIPSLLVIMILFWGIYKNWKPWMMGIVFLLLLDVKEYIFLMFGLGYFIWIVIKYFKIRNIKSILLESIQVYGFSLVYIILMFTTSIIPVNMFLASTFGFITIGATYLTHHFSADTVGLTWLEGEEVKTIFQFAIDEDLPFFLQILFKIFNTILSYIGKTLYPQTFSFSSIPKVMLIPSIYMAVVSFKNAYASKKGKLREFNLIFPILMFTYLLIYLLRASVGRYLLPIVPFFAIYFLLFLNYKGHNKKELKNVLLLTLFFIIGGFFFEVGFLPFKIAIEITLFLCVAFVVLKPFALSKRSYILFEKFTVFFFIIIMLIIGLRFLATDRQAGGSRLYGVNREIEEVIDVLPEERKIWINDFVSFDLMKTKMGLTYAWPEWKWDLAEFIPKRYLLKSYGEKYLYNEKWDSIELFKEYLEENSIEYVVIMTSEVENEEFMYQEYLEDFKEESWLIEEKVQELQNKKVYLFKVDFE